jgi:hypothetical protein
LKDSATTSLPTAAADTVSATAAAAPPPGIHELSADAYHADPCAQPSLSSSIAHLLIESSPAHARVAHPRLNPDYQRVDSDRFDLGNTVHALLLEECDPEAAVAVIHANDWRTNAAKEQREFARAEGKIPLLTHQLDSVLAMCKSVRRQITQTECDPPLLGVGKPEQTLIWQEGDVTCRALVDWLHDDCRAIDDIKTTSASANPDRWTRTLYSIGADVQAAFHLRGLKALTGKDAEMRYIVVETAPPFALSVVSLAPSALSIAQDKCEWAINRWRECMESGQWPSYPRKVAYAEAPAWAEVQWLEKEARAA